MPNLNNIIDDIGQYLKYQIEENQNDIEISQEITEKLTKAKTQQTANKLHTTQSTIPPKTKQKTTIKPETKQEPMTTIIENATNMDEITAQINACTKCSLSQGRTNTVPGQGSNRPEIMFIGEAPGAKEDELGQPFVGRSGNFLTKMITAMGYKREEVFIGNILKCRPPDNRKPTPAEIEICIPFLKQQIAILKPKVIIALGATSVKGLLGKTPAITKLRGEWQKFEGIPLMPTFHPAFILRNQTKKGDLWNDLKKVLTFLGKKPPPIQKS